MATINYPTLPIEEELKNSYLTYAMSVIVSRALPDVRDGLKPSQRRILVAMGDLKLSPGAKYRKCAKIAGDTSGNYHPHGEGVIYPTLVRLAQPFNMRHCLIDGQGNFGSVDGDPPAAMRYTEAKMTAVAMEMLEDIDKDTVDFIPNYDETREEPVVLPSKFPNLLVNGSLGIAVGMSTSVPPHNLREVCDGIVRVIEQPEIPVAELCRIIRGPDFPTGAIICGAKDVHRAYCTGRGIITVRAKYHNEELRAGREAIVFSEIPYQLNKARVLERIAELVKEGKIKGIADVRDESDRKDTVRIVVELKRGENAEVVVNQLFKFTPLQGSFSIIMIALVNSRPQMLNIKELVEYFILHRREVIRRRTLYLLDKAEKRAHIVEGLMLAIEHIDEVIEVIRKSPEAKQAKELLQQKYPFSDIQINAVFQMRLGTLTGLEYHKLQEEHRDLSAHIGEYRKILADENLILGIVKQETIALRDKYGTGRLTEIAQDALEDFEITDIIPDNQWVVLVTHNGYIKRMAIESYRKQHRGGSGVTTADMYEGDFVEHFFLASAHQYLLLFTDQGKIHWLKVYDIPESTRTAKGRAIVNLLELDQEGITALIPVHEFDDRLLMMATQKGVVKKTLLSAFSRPTRGGIRAIALDEGDRLIRTVLTHGDQDVILGTAMGKACRFQEKDVRSLGRAARGVIGVRLKSDDKVIGMVAMTPGETLFTISQRGYGKLSNFDEYRITKRGSQGVLNIKRTEKTGNVVAILPVKPQDELIIITLQGMVIRISANLPLLSRNTQGVRLIRLKSRDTVVSVAKLPKEMLDQLELEEESLEEAGETAPEGGETEGETESGDEEGETESGDEEGETESEDEEGETESEDEEGEIL